MNNSYYNDMYKGMSDRERIKAGCFQLIVFLAMVVIGMVICALMSSCSTTRIVEVEKIRNDTVWENHTERDSIYIEHHDSIVLHTKGDTVTVERWHWRDRWRERVVHDTVYKSKTDTVMVNRVTESHYTGMTWWERWRVRIGTVMIIALGIFAIYCGVRLILSIKKKLP